MKAIYSKTALKRTIRNRLAEARADGALHPWPKIRSFQQEATKLLEEVQRAVDAVEDLPKTEALKLLSRLARPNLPPGASGSLAGLRTAVTSIGLDDLDDVITVKDAEAKVRMLIEHGNTAQGQPGMTPALAGLDKAESCHARLRHLSDAGIFEVNFRKFWEIP